MPSAPSLGTSADKVEPLFGQVLEIVYDSEDVGAIGSVLVKIYNISSRKEEENVSTIAYPANRNIIKYPVPGELVLLTVGLADTHVNGHINKRYYYTHIVNVTGKLTTNSNPYYLENVSRSEQSEVFNTAHEKRFEQKLQNNESFLLDGKLNNRPSMQPFEGDILLQGRWGSSIRFGSSGLGDNNQWSDKKTLSGAAVTALTVNRGNKATDTAVENVNTDDSSIYMCGINKIPVVLACSSTLKSFRYVYNVGPKLDSKTE